MKRNILIITIITICILFSQIISIAQEADETNSVNENKNSTESTDENNEQEAQVEQSHKEDEEAQAEPDDGGEPEVPQGIEGKRTERFVNAVDPPKRVFGFLPNSSGGTDLKIYIRQAYKLKYGFSFSLDVKSFDYEADEPKYEMDTGRKDIDLFSDVFFYILPIISNPKKRIFMSFEPGINIRYFMSKTDSIGSKQGVQRYERINFAFSDAFHRLMGSLFFEFSLNIRGVRMDLRWDYFPYMLSVERGERRFSSADKVSRYRNANGMMGGQLGYELIIPINKMIIVPLGDLKLEIIYLLITGDITSTKRIPVGDHTSDIEQSYRLTRHYLTFSAYYSATVLQPLIKIIPSLGVTYEWYIDKLGDKTIDKNLL